MSQDKVPTRGDTSQGRRGPLERMESLKVVRPRLHFRGVSVKVALSITILDVST